MFTNVGILTKFKKENTRLAASRTRGLRSGVWTRLGGGETKDSFRTRLRRPVTQVKRWVLKRLGGGKASNASVRAQLRRTRLVGRRRRWGWSGVPPRTAVGRGLHLAWIGLSSGVDPSGRFRVRLRRPRAELPKHQGSAKNGRQ